MPLQVSVRNTLRPLMCRDMTSGCHYYPLDLSGPHIKVFWKFDDFCRDYIRDTQIFLARTVGTTIRVVDSYSGVLDLRPKYGDLCNLNVDFQLQGPCCCPILPTKSLGNALKRPSKANLLTAEARFQLIGCWKHVAGCRGELQALLYVTLIPNLPFGGQRTTLITDMAT